MQDAMSFNEFIFMIESVPLSSNQKEAIVFNLWYNSFCFLLADRDISVELFGALDSAFLYTYALAMLFRYASLISFGEETFAGRNFVKKHSVFIIFKCSHNTVFKLCLLKLCFSNCAIELEAFL